jgi:hypothetical protein
VTTTKKKAREARQAAILAERRRQAAARRRQRIIIATSAVSAVLLVVVVLVVVKLAGGTPKSSATTVASADVIASVTSVPAATLDTIGKGGGKALQSVPAKVTGNAVLKADGKPLVLFVGGEFCPYCAAERWAVVEALSRFGTFSGLGQTRSSASDVFPNTPTLSFHGSTYTSDYITFQGVEQYTNQRSGNFYTPLDTLTAQQQQLFHDIGKDSYPFMDFAGQATVTSASIDPSIFAGKTQAQVAAAMKDPTTDIAKAVGGVANAFTAIICGLTGNQPAAVCTTPAATAYQATYGG